MNDEASDLSHPDEARAPSGFGRRLLRRLIQFLFVVLALAVLAAGCWLGYKYLRDLRQVPVPSETDAAAVRLQTVEEAVRDLASGVEALRSAVREQQAEVDAKLSSLESTLTSQSEEIAAAARARGAANPADPRLASLAEVEALVKLASQQLTLHLGTPRVIETLETADELLAILDDSEFYPIRGLIAADLQSLRRAPLTDVPGIFLRLEALKERVEELPLSLSETRKATPALESAGGDEGEPLWQRAWSSLASLVVIRDHGEERARPLLAEAEAAALSLRLLIALDAAQLAWLGREHELYLANLDAFMDLATARLPQTTDSMSQIRGEVADLREVSFAPSLTLSSEILNELRTTRKRVLGSSVISPSSPTSVPEP